MPPAKGRTAAKAADTVTYAESLPDLVLAGYFRVWLPKGSKGFIETYGFVADRHSTFGSAGFSIPADFGTTDKELGRVWFGSLVYRVAQTRIGFLRGYATDFAAIGV